jgi:aminoglycoside phosphotransferase (APT) family kinase protein
VTETILHGGDLNLVVRVGDTVRRPIGSWSPAVHALLRHFEAVGIDDAPRFLGVDDKGREVLSYVEGDAASAPVPTDDEVVVELGRLLRRLHDAQHDFRRPPGAAWQRYPGEPSSGEVVCHNDLFWTNIVFRGGRPVALIDWDLATPGSRLNDLGSAAAYWVPLRVDEQARGWGVPTNRRRERLRLLCDAYGLDAEQRAGLLDAFLARRRLGYEAHRLWGGVERRPGWAAMWDAGSGERMLANVRWIEEHRPEIEAWLR